VELLRQIIFFWLFNRSSLIIIALKIIFYPG